MLRDAVVAIGAVAVAAAAAYVARRVRPRRHPRLRLTYLDMKSFGEPTRLALVVGGLEFEDVRASYEEVAEMRRTGRLPHGQVPVLEIDGTPYPQANAILRWVGTQTGLYTPELALRIDATEELLGDIKKLFTTQWYKHIVPKSLVTGAFHPGTALNPQQQDAVVEFLSHDLVPSRFAQLERSLEDCGGCAAERYASAPCTPEPRASRLSRARAAPQDSTGVLLPAVLRPYLCGKALTICDLSFYVLGTGLRDGTYCPGIATSVLDGCPRLLELLQRIDNHPKVAAWNRAH
jgi:glutathione S-transferase